VVITTDVALTTECRAMREITLSGAADGAGDSHSEEDRDGSERKRCTRLA